MVSSFASEAELIAEARERGVRFVRFVYCDPSGVIRAKQVHVDRLEGKAISGIGLTRAQNAVNLFEDLADVEGLAPVGEIRLLPDLSTFTVLPWTGGRSAALLVDQVDHDMTDWGCCPRSFLRRVVAEAAEVGIRVKAAFETEFYLAKATDEGYEPFNNGPCYSTAGLDRAIDVMSDISEALVAQGIVVEQVINEYGAGQQEISIRYADALDAADNHLRLRDTVRGVAEAGHGLTAMFGPKPFPDQVGSGAHLHFSLWDLAGERNLTHDASREGGLSDLGASFLAGILANLEGLVALTCPSYLSYARLAPGMWAGSTVSWGFDNREATIRVASPFRGHEEESTNAELKAVDSSCNPHIALGGVILAGLDGVRRGLSLPAPARVDPAKLDDEQARECGIRSLPGSLMEALTALRHNEVLTTGLGPMLTRTLLATREREYERAIQEGDDWVRNYTANVY